MCTGALGFGANDGAIRRRSRLSGFAVEEVATGQSEPCGLAVDDSTGVMFWASQAFVRRAKSTGTLWTVAELANGQNVSMVVALINSEVYWTNSGTAPAASIRKTNAAGALRSLTLPHRRSQPCWSFATTCCVGSRALRGQPRAGFCVCPAVPVSLATHQAFPHGIAVDDQNVDRA